jgi:hypothetical protein
MAARVPVMVALVARRSRTVDVVEEDLMVSEVIGFGD